jgi:hypothetical protein
VKARDMMNVPTQNPLQWFLEKQLEGQRHLRDTEDNLFNLTITLFLASLGTTTTLKGVTDAAWSVQWRILLLFAVAAVIGGILLMALLLHNGQEKAQHEIDRLAAQLAPGVPVNLNTLNPLLFYVRWGAVTVMGVVTLLLIWQLG